MRERGLDFADAGQVFESLYFTEPDVRYDYPEPRFQTFGMMKGRLVMFAWTPIDAGIRVISMRKCNERERRRYQARMG